MNKKQEFVSILLVVLLTVLFYIPSAQANKKVMGKTFYTTANIWYENPDKILSTNYHRGIILPVGTKVTIKKLSGNEIQFIDESGQAFKMIYLKKYSSHKMTLVDYFNQYFSEKNPMRKRWFFEKFSKDEKDNINIGEIAEGMSKSAVLTAYGYPPSHKTPSLKGNIWIYWINRFIKKVVYFKDDKVVKIGRRL